MLQEIGILGYLWLLVKFMAAIGAILFVGFWTIALVACGAYSGVMGLKKYGEARGIGALAGVLGIGALILLMVVFAITGYVRGRNQAEMHPQTSMSGYERTLQNKREEVRNAKLAMMDQLNRTASLMLAMNQEKSQLQENLRRTAEATGVTDFQIAARDPKLAQFLEAIQRKDAYVNRLQEVVGKLKAGVSEADSLEAKYDDDIRIASVLGNEVTADLIKRMDRVIEFGKEDFNQLKDDEASARKSYQQIWAEAR